MNTPYQIQQIPGFKPRLLALAIAAAFAPVAGADQATSESQAQTQDDMVIYGATYRNTATKTALKPEETPQGYSVIDKEDLVMRNADSVTAALRYASGVNTELRGGAVTRYDEFTIRGFPNYQNAYDGLQLLHNDWNIQPQIDAKALEQVEVFKGPVSALYGSMPPGGMVNLISKKPQMESAHSIELATGSYSKKEASFDSTGQIGDSDLAYRFVGLVRDQGSQANTAGEKRRMFAPSVDWQVSDNTLVNFNLYYQDDPEMGIHNTLPATGMFRNNPNGKFDKNSYAGDQNWNAYDREVTLFGYKINHELNDNWTFLHQARVMDAEAYQENTYSSGLAEDMRTLNRNAYITDEKSDAITLDNQLSGRIMMGAVEHNLLIGLDYQKLDSRIRYEDDAIVAIDLFNQNNNLVDRNTVNMTNTVYSSDFDKKHDQTGIYLQDQIRIDQLTVIGSVRYDDYSGTEKGRKYNADVDIDVNQSKVSGRLGALYSLNNGLAPFFSFAQSFEPQTGSNRNGDKFEPSAGEQWETGVKYKSDDGRLTGSVVAYRITKDNVPTRDPEGSPYDEIQAGEIESKGVELELNAQVNNNLSLSAFYTWQNVEVTKDNNGLQGKTPIRSPEQMLSVWANYDIYSGALAGTSLGYGVRHIGKTQMDALNTDTVPSATLMDLSVAYDLAGISHSMSGASVRFSVNNLLDEDSYTCYDSNNCWFGAERRVEASLKYDF